MTAPSHRSARRERRHLLRQLEDWLEMPMIVLGMLWLVLLIIELVQGESALLSGIGRVIWAIFIADYLLRLVLAPDKGDYLRRNLLNALALLLPALRSLRLLRVVRLLRVGRGLTLVRILSSTNRGMAAVRRAMRRRGAGYVVTLTLLVLFAGAAGMYAFEDRGSGFASFGESLWWTAMLLTSLGSEAWPHSNEGRVLCFLLSLYGFAVFGYLTATLASFFVDRDASDSKAAIASQSSVAALQDEVRRLRLQLQERDGLPTADR